MVGMEMECKLCSKRFSNGKALGGHMRSHFATLPLPPKTPQRHELSEPLTESTSSIFSCDDTADKSSLLSASYALREKPKKSARLADPDFFDRESESESTRPRCKSAKRTSHVEVEPLMAELEMEEDVALCLIMLSKDVWTSSKELRMREKAYKCERCDKVFKSSQGLGSHMSIRHRKKIKVSVNGVCENEFRKPETVHDCKLCGRIFRSAQALGGHKRSHILASKLGTSLAEENDDDDGPIDLNIPLVKNLLVSDAEFVG